MAINPKSAEKIDLFESELKARGDSLTAQEIADHGYILKGAKLQDELRAAIYLESLHQRDQQSNWDKLIPVDALISTLRENLQ